MNGSTLRPGESSVYNLSMVFDEPPAPAARVELGFETVVPVARRRTVVPDGLAAPGTGRPAREVFGTSESDIVVLRMWSRIEANA